MTFTILTMTRGDESRIEEWVEYHAALGFNDFYFILDAPIDNTESVLRGLDVDATITIDVREAKGDYYDGYTQAERWEAVKKWRTENDAALKALGTPVVDPQTVRQHEYFEEVMQRYSEEGDGWLALIDMDEFIVFPGGQSIQEMTSDRSVPRIRLLNFNFDMKSHVPGSSILSNNLMRWDREDIIAYGKGWDTRVKTIARYDSLLPMVSVHPISKGPFVTLDPEVGRLHHYRTPDQGIAELPYTVADAAALGVSMAR